MSDDLCGCSICTRRRKLETALKPLRKDVAAKIREIYDELEDEHEAASTELGWHKMVIEGTWSKAAEIQQSWIDKWNSDGG